MADSVGKIGLDLVVNQGAFSRQMSGIQSLAKKTGTLLAGAFAVKKLVDFGKSCLDLGSDLQEVQNVVDVSFPKMSSQIDKFAKSAAGNFGLSETMAKKFTGTFGAMSKSFGFTEKEAYKMSTALTGLAGDVASFYNISQDEAYTKLKSVFTGETETLKELGVVMTQSALDSYALANGYGKVTAKMSETEKVALRFAFVQQQLSGATGDFARTSNSWANQTRLLSLQFDSLKASIGQGLINAFTPVIKVINIILGKLQVLAKSFQNLTKNIFGDAAGGNELSTSTSQADASMGSAAVSSGKIADNTKKTAKEAKKIEKSLFSFDSMNKLTADISSSGDSSGSDTGAVGGGGVATIGVDTDTSKAKKKITALDKFMQTFKKKLEPTTNALKKLCNEGLQKLGSFAWGTLKDFYHNFLVPVGSWVLGQGLPSFIEITNDMLNCINWGKLRESLGGFYDAIAQFSITIGKGLLWLYKNVLCPLASWTISEVVPRFFDTLRIAIDAFNAILNALQPLAQWLFDEVLKPIAKWTAGKFLNIWDSINSALSSFAGWCKKNPGTIRGVTVTVGAFFAAWKTTELLAFLGQVGGVKNALIILKDALFGVTVAKLKDKAETIALKVLYAKDFLVSIGQSTAAMVKQASRLVINTALKAKDTVAQYAMTSATVAWNAVCGVATTLTTALGAAMAFLTSPIGLAIAAITAIIAIGVLLYKNWDTVKAKATQIWDKIKEIFSSFVKKVGDMMTKFNQSIGNIWGKIKSTFNSVGSWIGSTFKNMFSKGIDALKSIFFGFFTKIRSVWGDIKGVFNTITSFVGGAFKKAWKGAWEGVKTIFKSVFNGLVSIAIVPINAIIGLINGMLKAVFKGVNWLIQKVNKVSFDVPDWVPGIGGSKWGFDIPKIDAGSVSIPTLKAPKLAQGGYVKANTPQLAMIGDNRHQGEVVAPEDKLNELLNNAIMQNTSMIVRALSDVMSKQNRGDIDLVINLGDKKIAKAVLDVAKAENKRIGKTVYNI